jgi:hypothetical protein
MIYDMKTLHHLHFSSRGGLNKCYQFLLSFLKLFILYIVINTKQKKIKTINFKKTFL